MKSSNALYGLAVVMGLVCLPSAVYADVTPDGFEECVGRAPGDSCATGVCRAQTCSRLDYENWDRDADGGPPTIDYDCLLCQRGTGGEGSSGDGSGCGSCAASAEGLGARGAALSFALMMGLFLGRARLRKPR
jgi:hypothetical protein